MYKELSDFSRGRIEWLIKLCVSFFPCHYKHGSIVFTRTLCDQSWISPIETSTWSILCYRCARGGFHRDGIYAAGRENAEFCVLQARTVIRNRIKCIRGWILNISNVDDGGGDLSMWISKWSKNHDEYNDGYMGKNIFNGYLAWFCTEK